MRWQTQTRHALIAKRAGSDRHQGVISCDGNGSTCLLSGVGLLDALADLESLLDVSLHIQPGETWAHRLMNNEGLLGCEGDACVWEHIKMNFHMHVHVTVVHMMCMYIACCTACIPW